jgi:hypothetical protein
MENGGASRRDAAVFSFDCLHNIVYINNIHNEII